MRPGVVCCGCRLDPIKCVCLDEDGLKIRDAAGKWNGKFGQPPVVAGEPAYIPGWITHCTAEIDPLTGSVLVTAFVASSVTSPATPFTHKIDKRELDRNGEAVVCRDSDNTAWYVCVVRDINAPGGAYAYLDKRPYKAPERFSGNGVTDALLDVQEAAKRIKWTTARFDMWQLGSSIKAAGTAAVFCQQRLNEQLQAGGIDCEFSRDAVRKRVAAELFMIERIKQHVLDVRRLGLLFNATGWDRDGMCDNGVDITT